MAIDPTALNPVRNFPASTHLQTHGTHRNDIRVEYGPHTVPSCQLSLLVWKASGTCRPGADMGHEL